MNKKILGVLSLPLLVAACSSEDLMTTPQGENGQYDVAKVDVELVVDNGQTRLATDWYPTLEAGQDELGFAWLGDGVVINPTVNGKAYQNHPLYTQEGGWLKPATSIYVGKYYSYYPYNEKVVNIGAIDFTLEEQPLIEGIVGYKNSAKNSIWISPRWTDVTVGGDINGENKAGRYNKITIAPRQFTNKAALALNYKNYKIKEGNTSIYDLTVAYKNVGGSVISVKSFDFAPTAETSANDWTTSSLTSGVTALTPNGVGGTLPAPTMVNGVSTHTGALELVLNEGYEIDGSKNYTTENFAYNALPAAEVIDEDTKVEVVMTTTYGILTINEPINKVAFTYVDGKGYAEKADGAKEVGTGKLLGAVDFDRSFLQVLGVTGKFVLEVDFSKAVMNGMCVNDDVHLQKLLNYYKNNKKGNSNPAVSEAKAGTDIVLNLNAKAGEFRLSQTSIALIKEINGTTGDKLVSIQPCSAHGDPAIVITGGGEVPNLDRVFETSIANVTLANEAWTWNSTAKKLSDMVGTLTNNGTLNIASTIVESDYTELINNNVVNFAGAKANVKTNLTNNVGKQINVAANGQMLSYNSIIVNKGNIDNDGVIGVVKGTSGEINNYGYIHNDADAKTYITNNQTSGASFSTLKSDANLIGTIELTNWNDNISVSNNTNQGFIKYAWTGEGTYVTPTPAVDVKYNYLIISKNIEFTEAEKEISYLEVKSGAGEVVITAESANNVFESPNRLKGFILPEGAQANIKLKNTVKAAAAFIKGELYVGGVFAYDQLNSYLGGVATDKDNIVEY